MYSELGQTSKTKLYSDVYSIPSQTSVIELFAKIVNSF